ncbi:hypothetical protein [Clostridium psychrophilum]|uniref:hypothetical protein n=1 Tax=Clostridium psychrophilum TaxID=132926 RepID=UPI001C0D30A9|nr:hypothetical protein [Clostridium psychrophilum]MBU3182501.1 hypothetical protein [Clostridium psychrophilum]
MKLTKIAFEKDNNIYIYDETNGQIKSLGDNSKSKDLLEISPDKTKLVFRDFNQGKAVYPPHINVYNVRTKGITDITVNGKSVQEIIDLKWTDNKNILITGHIDPSSSGYAVYNIKSKVSLISCVGTIRDVTMDEKNILYSDTPHTFPLPKANLYFNGNKIYEATDIKEEIYDGAISKDGKMIAFRSWINDTNNVDSKTSAYLNVAKINSDKKSVSNFEKIKISSDTTGKLKFDDENNIVIVGDESIYKLKSKKLIKSKNMLTKKVEISNENLVKFKQVLEKQFPEDFITEETVLEDMDISNMVEF